MTPPNIERFNELTGNIFAFLYEQFPLPKLLKPEKFIEGGKDAAFDTNSPSGAGPTEATDFFVATVEWLNVEGYVSYKNMGHFDFREAVLTSKSLAILNGIPASLENTESLGDRLTSAAKSGASEIIKTIARETIGIGIHVLVASSRL